MFKLYQHYNFCETTILLLMTLVTIQQIILVKGNSSENVEIDIKKMINARKMKTKHDLRKFTVYLVRQLIENEKKKSECDKQRLEKYEMERRKESEKEQKRIKSIEAIKNERVLNFLKEFTLRYF